MSDFHDLILVYPSEEDEGLYVAHSLRTDQVGVADNYFDALLALVQGVKNLFVEKSNDPNVRVYQPAPAAVMSRVASVKGDPIPEELWQAILERLKPTHEEGYWEDYECPKDQRVDDRHSFLFREVTLRAHDHELELV